MASMPKNESLFFDSKVYEVHQDTHFNTGLSVILQYCNMPLHLHFLKIILLDTLMVSMLSKKFPDFYGIRSCITVSTSTDP
jgi:hypothetical protein